MRKVASLRWMSVALFALLFPSFAWGQYLSAPGPGPIAPASDVSDSSFLAPETFEPAPPLGYAGDIEKAKREAASVVSVAPGTSQVDREASAGAGRTRPPDQSDSQQERQPLPEAPALSSNFNGIDYTGWRPPDPVMAAGPTNLVLSTNGSVTIRDKTGTLVASTSLESFFSLARAAGENAFDPRVLFDTGSGRFFLLAIGKNSNSSCTAGTCVSHFFLAISKSSSPATIGSSDWFFYTFDGTLDGATPTANWVDNEGLGVDGSVVVLAANMYTFSDNKFQKAKIRILDKSVLIAGGAVTWFDFWDMTDPGGSTSFSFSLRPAQTFGSPGTFFLVSASQTTNSCNLIVWGIQNPLSSPTLNALTATAGGTCAVPPAALQAGGGTPIDTGDTRLGYVVYRNGSLWTAHAIQMNFGSGNVSAIRWVQINVGGWPNSVNLTQDSTFGADGFWYFYPGIVVDTSNNLAIVFTRSGASEFASARYTGRLSTDGANTLQPSALLKAGTANYTNLANGVNRWGDYHGMGLDPSDGSFWGLGEYASGSSTWGTWVGNFTFGATGGTGPLVLRDAIYLYGPPLDGKGDKVLVGVDCDVFELVLDVTSGYTNLAMGQGSTLANALGTQSPYVDTIYSTDAMFAYALYRDEPVKVFVFNDKANPSSSAQMGTATVFGYCYSTKLTAHVYFQQKDICTNTYSDGHTTSCTVADNGSGVGSGGFSDLILRDAIYLYGQPLNGKGDKILAGENCDAFQLILDVTAGYTDLAMGQSSTLNNALAAKVAYPDRILDSAAMFSYALYDNQAVKAFVFNDKNNPASSAQIGTATAFGYCYSTNPAARVYLRELDTCTDKYSNGQISVIPGC